MRSDRRRASGEAADDGAGSDGGMVTAELAACLPILVIVLAVALSAVAVVGARVRCADAAREAARAAARGDTVATRRLADAPGTHVSVQRGAATIIAVARVTVHPLGGWLPSVTVTERAVAAREPTDAGVVP